MRSRYLLTFFLCLVFSYGSSSLVTASEVLEVAGYTEEVSDRKYYFKVRELIGNAESTIDLSLESAAIGVDQDDPVKTLLDELIRATKRGVAVRVFLNTFSSPDYDAAIFLRDDVLQNLVHHGVNVHYVNPEYYLADRTLIVDKAKVLEGGPPWTREGFEKYLATATLTYSDLLAQAKERRLELLPLWNIRAEKEHRREGRLAVPVYLLKEVNYFPAMIRNEDDNALRVYLSLLRLFYQTQQVEMTVPFADLSKHIPDNKLYRDETLDFQVLSAIERLEQQYMLLDIKQEEADRIQVELLLPKKLHPATGVPNRFFDEGFSKELSATATYVYMLISYRMQTSGESPVWLGSEKNVQQDFPVEASLFRAGVRELRRSNLLEVFPFYLNRNKQTINLQKPEYRYLINEIPSLSERLATWDQLRDRFGEMSFHKARDLADILGEPGDPKVIVAYIELLQKFSIEDIRSLSQHVAALPGKSTPEMLDYLSALLKNETQRTFQLATR